MNTHFLRINTEKTEIVLFRPKAVDEEVIINGVILDSNDCIRFSDDTKNLGVWLDQHLNFDKQVNKTVSHCHKLIKDMWKVRNVLSQSHTEKLVHSMVSSKLDLCNSLYYNMSKINYKKLQRVQNSAARLVCKVGRHSSISEILKSLHWLTIENRILFKIILLTHKSIWGKCSTNLVQLLSYKSYTRSTSDFLLFDTPVALTKYGKRTFSFAAPRLWNVLPYKLRYEEDTVIFKKQLKTLLFTDSDNLKQTAFCYD